MPRKVGSDSRQTGTRGGDAWAVFGDHNGGVHYTLPAPVAAAAGSCAPAALPAGLFSIRDSGFFKSGWWQKPLQSPFVRFGLSPYLSNLAVLRKTMRNSVYLIATWLGWKRGSFWSQAAMEDGGPAGDHVTVVGPRASGGPRRDSRRLAQSGCSSSYYTP